MAGQSVVGRPGGRWMKQPGIVHMPVALGFLNGFAVLFAA
jgi:hypothetical protein